MPQEQLTMDSFNSGLVSCAYSSRATWTDGKRRSHTFAAFTDDDTSTTVEEPALGAGALRRQSVAVNGLHLQRECFIDEEATLLAVRIRAENQGAATVALDLLQPVQLAELTLGETPAADWTVVRQPRMKNDMPACFRLGSTGEEIWDAVRGLPETGGASGGEGREPPRRFVSSEICVLASDEASLALGVAPITDCLVSAELVVNERHDGMESFGLTCHADGQELAPGKSATSPWVVVILGRNYDAVLARYTDALLAATPARPSLLDQPPTVWCSWYYYGDGFSQEEFEPNLDYLEKTSFPTNVILIDECWDMRWGDWEPNARWPDLPTIPQRIRAAGYEPGIWTCCFLAEPRSSLRFRQPHWLLRDATGIPIRFNMNATENYVLDPTHPEVQGFIEDLYRRLTHDWGFTYHKIDFTRAVGHPDAVFHDRTCNRAQAYRAGLEAVRRGMGPDAYLNICGGFYGPAMGFADAQRTGSDVSSVWPLHPGDPALPFGPFTIKQNTLRSWMNRLWHNDGDSLVVRRRPEAFRDEDLSLGLMNDDEAETSALNQYLGGGLVSYTENLPEIDQDRLLQLRKCSPSIGVAATPVDLREGARFQSVFLTRIRGRPAGSWATVSLVNWSNTTRDMHVKPADLGLPKSWQELLVSQYHESGYRLSDPGDIITIESVPAHACRVLKIQPRLRDMPQLLRTDGHFSMGAVEVKLWRWDGNSLTIEIDWPWPTPLRISALMPDGNVVEKEVRSGVIKL